MINVFLNGKIKVPYFRHAVTEYNPRTYYDKPNKSQIHKDAKMLLKYYMFIYFSHFSEK